MHRYNYTNCTQLLICVVHITVLYRDYAHPNCMLQSSYRWDGLNFENSCFALKLSPPQVFASKLRPLMKKLSLFCLRPRPTSS